MAFQQLHYTSCHDGPTGHSGYQFCAVTPGTPLVVMREVEDRTVYHPPPRLLANPRPDEPDAYPVVLSHGPSTATGAVITAHVVFAGTDYSGRPGNYFAHALITETPDVDFGPVLPAELWGADLWQRHPARAHELPELPGPPQRGIIDPPGVQAFLDAHGMEGTLGELLTAVSRAMGGAPPVLLECHDATESAWWIAAVSYLLGERIGRQMTFTTYSNHPESALFHLIGALADDLPPDVLSCFQLFELTSGRTPGGDVHPLAGLLADTGVLAASTLWRQAMAFASGTEESLDDWLPVVAIAAALLGRPLTQTERQTLPGWADGAITRLPTDIADVVLRVVLDQPDEALTQEQLTQLLGLAERAGAPARGAQIEELLVELAVGRICTGSPIEQGLADLLHHSPAVMHGLLARLDSEPPQAAEHAVSALGRAAVQRSHLDGYPTLTEAWLLRSAADGSVTPLRALDEIADTRAGAGLSPRIDLTLLTRLWPAGCPPDQLSELLGLVADEPLEDAVAWIVAQISALAANGEPDEDWYRLAGVLADHPIRSAMPWQDLQVILDAAEAGPLITRARAEARNGDAHVFADLFALYQAAGDGRVPGLLRQELPALLAEAAPLGPALRDCPDEIAREFRLELENRLTSPQADLALAVRVFTALADPEVAAQPTLADHLRGAAERVRDWNRGDVAMLSRALHGQSAAAGYFQAWSRPTRLARFWGRSP